MIQISLSSLLILISGTINNDDIFIDEEILPQRMRRVSTADGQHYDESRYRVGYAYDSENEDIDKLNENVVDSPSSCSSVEYSLPNTPESCDSPISKASWPLISELSKGAGNIDLTVVSDSILRISEYCGESHMEYYRVAVILNVLDKCSSFHSIFRSVSNIAFTFIWSPDKKVKNINLALSLIKALDLYFKGMEADGVNKFRSIDDLTDRIEAVRMLIEDHKNSDIKNKSDLSKIAFDLSKLYIEISKSLSECFKALILIIDNSDTIIIPFKYRVINAAMGMQLLRSKTSDEAENIITDNIDNSLEYNFSDFCTLVDDQTKLVSYMSAWSSPKPREFEQSLVLRSPNSPFYAELISNKENLISINDDASDKVKNMISLRKSFISHQERVERLYSGQSLLEFVSVMCERFDPAFELLVNEKIDLLDFVKILIFLYDPNSLERIIYEGKSQSRIEDDLFLELAFPAWIDDRSLRAAKNMITALDKYIFRDDENVVAKKMSDDESIYVAKDLKKVFNLLKAFSRNEFVHYGDCMIIKRVNAEIRRVCLCAIPLVQTITENMEADENMVGRCTCEKQQD